MTDRDLIKLLQYVYGFVNVKLGDIVEINRGVRLVRNQLKNNGEYPVYQNSMKPLGYFDKSNCTEKTTFIIAAGAAGEVGFSSNAFWAADDCFYFNSSEFLNSKYLWYLLKSKQKIIFRKVRKASVPRISRTEIENIEVCIPNIEMQESTVKILDNFDKICSDLKIGLPAEIEARKKQYEYYREKLLTFKRLSV